MVQATVGKIVGLPGGGWWGQVHDFTPTDEEKIKARGRLVAAVSVRVEAQEELSVVTTGREVLARLHELYYADISGGAMERLGGAVTAMAEEYAGIEVGAAALVGGVVYLAVAGGAGIWVKEGEREGWLVEPGGGQAKTLSGWAKEGMTLVVGNTRFWEGLPEGVVRAVLGASENGPEDAAEAMGTVLFGRGKSEGEVGAVVRIGVGETEPQEEVETVMEAEVVKDGKADDEKTAKGMVEKFREKWGEVRRRMQTSVYVVHQDKETARRRMRRAGMGFLILAVLLFGGGRAYRQVREQKQAMVNEKVEAIVFAYNEAKSLIDLNQTRARQMLIEVKQEIAGLDERGRGDARIRSVEAEFGEVLGAASGVKRVTGSEVVDLGLVREGMTALGLAAGDGKLWVAGSEGRIVRVDSLKKSGQVVWGGNDTGEAAGVATYPGRVYGWSAGGIAECEVGGECARVIEKSAEWGEIAEAEAWAGNIYLLDKGAGQIWKYQRAGSGFGGGQKWLAEAEDGSSLDMGTGMAIDGSVWVAGGGRVGKYIRGVKEAFEITGLDKDLGGELRVDTDDEKEKLYVLDKANGRVVAINKQTGEYMEQWVWEKLSQAVDLAVDEKAGKIYIVGDKYVWEIGM